MRNEQNFGRILIRIAVALDREIATVADHMRVRHDAIAFNNEAGADAAPDHSCIPRRAIIRRNFRRGNAHQAFLDRAIGFWWRHRDRNRNYILRRSSGFRSNSGRSRLSGRSRRLRSVLLTERYRCSEHNSRNENWDALHAGKSGR